MLFVLSFVNIGIHVDFRKQKVIAQCVIKVNASLRNISSKPNSAF